MSINSHLNEVLKELLSKPSEIINNQQLIHCIDLTLLNEQASQNDLITLNHLANKYTVAAVCVYPKDLVHFKPSSAIDLATVVNFPQADETLSTCIKQINLGIQNGVKEIDYVVPYMSYLQGKRQQTIQHATEIAAYCKEHKLTLKIILETGAFTDLNILNDLALELLALDLDFLKTSTGKISQGASLSAVFTLLSAIKDSGKNCGIKISGGIKTVEQAKNHAYLAQFLMNKAIEKSWFRVGASSLLKELTKTN